MCVCVCVDFRVPTDLLAGGTGVRTGLDTPKQVCVNWKAFCGEYVSVFGFNLVRHIPPSINES